MKCLDGITVYCGSIVTRNLERRKEKYACIYA
jgi:hypothetical protein